MADLINAKLRAHPVAKSFLLEEEFAMARFQLIEALERHRPHRLASCRRGSLSLWDKVERVMYDASSGQFRGMKPYSTRRNFRNFVANVFTLAKKICLEDDGTISKTTQDLNAIAIMYDEVCQAAKDEIKDKKQDEKEKKERQAVIEKDVLNLNNSPPSFTPSVLSPRENTNLDLLSAVSESVAKGSESDNQIVTPPVAKEVVIDVEQDKRGGVAPCGPKRKNSGLVEGGNSKKPSSVKNPKFRSSDTVNFFDKALPTIESTAREISGALAKPKTNPMVEKIELLERLLKVKQNMITLGENTDWITAQIKAVQGQD